MHNVVKELKEKLDKIAPGWENYTRKEIFKNDEVFLVLNDYVEVMLKNIKNEGNNKKEEYIKILESEKSEALKLLISTIEKATKAFLALTSIRESENLLESKILISSIFNEYIIRLNPSFLDEHKKFNIEDYEDFKRLVNTLDSLTTYYVTRALSKKAIIEDFRAESECNDDICEYFADLVDENFRSIQLNIICSNLSESNE